MAGFDGSLNEPMPAFLIAQQDLLAESWNQCFEAGTFQLRAGALASLNPTELPAALQQPGLVAVFEETETGALVLIPASCGLPAWYASPNDSQKSRLDTLAMEWSLNLWPEDHMVERSGSLAVPNLAEHLTVSQPASDAALMSLDVVDASDAVVGTFYVVWPIANRIWEVAAPAPPPRAEPAAAPVAAPAPAAPPRPRGPDPLARLRKLPVTVSVRLAEKKISMSQLLAITPGALVAFNKSCDGMLDLYVNNSLYCRGEAIKIGESFGLKIDHVGVHVERESKLLQR